MGAENQLLIVGPKGLKFWPEQVMEKRINPTQRNLNYKSQFKIQSGIKTGGPLDRALDDEVYTIILGGFSLFFPQL